MVLEGVYTPCVTPFDEDGELDLSAYAEVIEFGLEAGIRGIVPAGTTGEYYAMTFEERVLAMRAAKDVAGGRAELIAGCNSGSTREVIRLAEAARDLGYDAALLATPHTSLPTQDELVAHYTSVARAVGLPVVLYSFPLRAGVEIGLDALDVLAEVPEIFAIKESSGDFSRFLAMRRRLGERLQISCGSDDQAVDYFGWGVRSWIAGTANVLPRHHVAILDAALRGDWAEAHRIFDGLLPWVQNMESGRYNQKAKLGLEHQGIRAGTVRQPLLPLSREESEELVSLLDAARAVPTPVPATGD
jgi:4-hydroxy-tetrahydrodipicolinate synthase